MSECDSPVRTLDKFYNRRVTWKTEQQPICPLRCKECGVEYKTGFNDTFCSEQCANRYIDGVEACYQKESMKPKVIPSSEEEWGKYNRDAEKDSDTDSKRRS